MPTNQEEPEISEEDRKRLERAARQVTGYVNFLRWTTNARRNEILKHPRHSAVMQLSPLLSGRFAFAVENDVLLLGAQPFEMAWLGAIPFEAAYMADRLYLTISGIQTMDATLSPLNIGIFVDGHEKLAAMAACSRVVPVDIEVAGGAVVAVGQPRGIGFPLHKGDVVKALQDVAAERRNKLDLSRYL